MNEIMPINELTNLVAVMDINEQDKNLIIQHLNRYAAVIGDAYWVVDRHCEEIVEFADESNLRDSEDDKLSETEEVAWVGLAEMCGDEDPRPEWYTAMWGY